MTMRYGYEPPSRSGGLLHWLVRLIVAVAISVGAVFGGRAAASRLCPGTCEALDPFRDVLLAPLSIAPDILCWAIVAAVVLALFVWIALAHRPTLLGLLLLSLLALAFIGALFSGDRDGLIDWEKFRSSEPLPAPQTQSWDITPEPAPLPAPEPAPVLACAADEFLGEGGSACLPCFETRLEPQAPRAYFAPMAFDAAWQYAKDNRYGRMADDIDASASHFASVQDLVIAGQRAAGGRALCASGAVLVVGSASADGPADRNAARAQRRAEQLAAQVRRGCGDDLPVFALSIGQSQASVDTAADRALTVLAVDTPDGAPVTRARILEELGFAMADQAALGGVLDRTEHFPVSSWQWQDKTAAAPMIAARPIEEVERLVAGAPSSCRPAIELNTASAE